VQIVCVAVVANRMGKAKDIVRSAYDEGQRPAALRWRFAEQRGPSDPVFGDRFPRAEWMLWPWPA
jgi:hypothetical protein